MNSTATQACSSAREPNTPIRLNQLAGRLTQLSEALDVLGDRISTALLPENPPVVGTGGEKACVCEIASDIEKHDAIVSVMVDRVNSWLDRLDI